MHEKLLIYVGTYTEQIKYDTDKILNGKGKGIYLFYLDILSGELIQMNKIFAVENPSYLTFDSAGKYLYCVNELKEFEGNASGAVSAFSIDQICGNLTFINRRATQGTDPCYVAVDDYDTHVLVSNYTSGSICVLPVKKDGSLEEAVQLIQHEGSGINLVRQTRPHPHSLIFDQQNRYVFVPDLGKDKVMIYKFDKNVPVPLSPGETPWITLKPGAGPRHCTFHPNNRFFYIINELDSTINAMQYDHHNGSFSVLQTVSSLPDGIETDNTCADIHITPDGRFIYGSNRGHDSIIIYIVDQSTGRLEYVGCEPSGGRTPRNFAIDPTGTFLLVGNQDTDNITIFRIDPRTGTIKIVSTAEVPTPVCIKPFYLR